LDSSASETAGHEELLVRALAAAALPPEVAAHLLEAGSVRTFDPGALIFEEGAEGDSMVLVLDGSAEVLRLADAGSGRYDVVGICEAGTTIGEMSLFDGRPRSATVRALDALVALHLERASVRRIMDQGAEQGLAFMGSLLKLQNARLRETNSFVLTVREVLRAVTHHVELDAVGNAVLRCVQKAVPQVAAAGFCIFSELSDRSEVRAQLGLAVSQVEVLEIERSGAAAALLASEPRYVELAGLSDDHPLQQAFVLKADDRILLFPLRTAQDALLGFVALLGRGKAFSHYHCALFEASFAPLGSLIANHAYAVEAHARRTFEHRRQQAER
jgi:CRP-like cAMP-binding protein